MIQDTLITALQLFAIGFTMNISGPCLLSCTPILATYIAGTQKKFLRAFLDVFIFSTGRLIAYMFLGFLVVAFMGFFKQFMHTETRLLFNSIAGIISVFLGCIIVLSRNKKSWSCKFLDGVFGRGNIFVLGFIMGVIPCFPLTILLFEIGIMSKNSFVGMFYAFFFGLGTFASTMLLLGGFSGLVSGVLSKIIKSEKSRLVLRVICAILLIALGIKLLFR
ncbi:MAG: sulfite exporter TauE/SafE family protein [Candidatus Omnitrophica bacterium]|nr:sulfite exporter TauE/SafE family protein [Candidatus Omnitrophota bacterium]